MEREFLKNEESDYCRFGCHYIESTAHSLLACAKIRKQGKLLIEKCKSEKKVHTQNCGKKCCFWPNKNLHFWADFEKKSIVTFSLKRNREKLEVRYTGWKLKITKILSQNAQNFRNCPYFLFMRFKKLKTSVCLFAGANLLGCLGILEPKFEPNRKQTKWSFPTSSIAYLESMDNFWNVEPTSVKIGYELRFLRRKQSPHVSAKIQKKSKNRKIPWKIEKKLFFFRFFVFFKFFSFWIIRASFYPIIMLVRSKFQKLSILSKYVIQEVEKLQFVGLQEP